MITDELAVWGHQSPWFTEYRHLFLFAHIGIESIVRLVAKMSKPRIDGPKMKRISYTMNWIISECETIVKEQDYI